MNPSMNGSPIESPVPPHPIDMAGKFEVLRRQTELITDRQIMMFSG